MVAWVMTVPKTVSWEAYKRELKAVESGDAVLNYRARVPKHMRVGDRCYVVHDGRVRGWMTVTGVERRTKAWTCTTTKKRWPPGQYIQRSGPFHEVDGPEMRGFQGVRSYVPESW
jgi:hypothetical protein